MDAITQQLIELNPKRRKYAIGYFAGRGGHWAAGEGD